MPTCNENSSPAISSQDRDAFIRDLEKIFEEPIFLDMCTDFVITKCGHSFEESSLKRHLSTHNNCPNCRIGDGTFVENHGVNRLARDFIDKGLTAFLDAIIQHHMTHQGQLWQSPVVLQCGHGCDQTDLIVLKGRGGYHCQESGCATVTPTSSPLIINYKLKSILCDERLKALITIKQSPDGDLAKKFRLLNHLDKNELDAIRDIFLQKEKEFLLETLTQNSRVIDFIIAKQLRDVLPIVFDRFGSDWLVDGFVERDTAIQFVTLLMTTPQIDILAEKLDGYLKEKSHKAKLQELVFEVFLHKLPTFPESVFTVFLTTHHDFLSDQELQVSGQLLLPWVLERVSHSSHKLWLDFAYQLLGLYQGCDDSSKLINYQRGKIKIQKSLQAALALILTDHQVGGTSLWVWLLTHGHRQLFECFFNVLTRSNYFFEPFIKRQKKSEFLYQPFLSLVVSLFEANRFEMNFVTSFLFKLPKFLTRDQLVRDVLLFKRWEGDDPLYIRFIENEIHANSIFSVLLLLKCAESGYELAIFQNKPIADLALEKVFKSSASTAVKENWINFLYELIPSLSLPALSLKLSKNYFYSNDNVYYKLCCHLLMMACDEQQFSDINQRSKNTLVTDRYTTANFVTALSTWSVKATKIEVYKQFYGFFQYVNWSQPPVEPAISLPRNYSFEELKRLLNLMEMYVKQQSQKYVVIIYRRTRKYSSVLIEKFLNQNRCLSSEDRCDFLATYLNSAYLNYQEPRGFFATPTPKCLPENLSHFYPSANYRSHGLRPGEYRIIQDF